MTLSGEAAVRILGELKKIQVNYRVESKVLTLTSFFFRDVSRHSGLGNVRYCPCGETHFIILTLKKERKKHGILILHISID